MALWMLEDAAPGGRRGGTMRPAAPSPGLGQHKDEGHGHPMVAGGHDEGMGGPVSAPVAEPPTQAAQTAQAQRPGLLPPLGTVVQAGAFGAVLGGATTGLVNTMRAHSGEITHEEAVRETVQMAAQGAASMAIASVAAHVVRVHPTFGLITLLGVGVAALAMTRQHKARQRRAVEPAFAEGHAAAKVARKARPAGKKPAPGA